MRQGLIIMPLIILFFVATFSQLYIYSPKLFNEDDPYDVGFEAQEDYLEERNYQIQMNATMGLLAFVIGLSAVGVGVGVQIFGSGLSDTSVKIMYYSTVYFAIWGVFSALSYVSITSIPVFGSLCWLVLTLIYAIGVFSSVGGN